jgi:hypothetical protein
MPSASWALQRAVFTALATDSALVALLGAARIYDDVPQRAELPYVTFGQATTRDWSTGDTAGEEHQLTLHVWSRADGRRETHEVAAAVRAVLHDAALPLDGHRLVQLRHELTEARREGDGETYRGLVRFRAVTEPL